MSANRRTVIDGTLELYSFIDGDSLERVSVVAVLPNHDWDNAPLNVLDWKIIREKVVVTYQTRFELLAPIYDSTFLVRQDRFPLPKPSRSKHWIFDKLSEQWRNRKTGARVPA